METCKGCGVLGSVWPLYARLVTIDGARRCFFVCSTCKALADREIVRRIDAWDPPFDRMHMGVGA